MKVFRFFQNTGGMNLRDNELSLRQDEAEEITNLHATSRGSWTSSNAGYVQLNDVPLEGGARITSLYEYVTLGGQSHLMAVAGDKWLTFEPSTGTATTVGSGLTSGQRMSMVTFKGLLIGCNGVDVPQTWDGVSAMAALSGWPPTIAGVTPGKPSLAQIFANRLVLSGDADNPSMLYISELENPQNFTPGAGASSAGAIQVSPGDGERITALKTLFLPLENEEVLVIFKERSTYILTGNDADTFTLQQLSDEFGAVGHQSVVLVGNELMFLSEEGVTVLSTATSQGNLTTGFLSDRIRPQMSRLNRTRLGDSFAVHLRNRQEVWWFVADGSAVQNRLVLVYNYGVNQAWSQRTGITAACGAVVGGALYTGDYSGGIHQQLRGNSYNGQPIAWTYRTGFLDFNAPRVRKRIRDVAVYLRQISQVDVTVRMGWDFVRGSGFRQQRTLHVEPDEASSIYGTAIFGQDIYNLSGTSVLTFIPDGSGRFFQLEFKGEAANRPVEIEGWTITTMEGGYR